MERFDYTEAMLAEGIVNDRFVALMKFEIARAREYYACADVGIPYISPSCRLPVRLARILYSRILDKIEENGYDVFRRRAKTSGLEKAAVLLQQSLSLASR